MRIKLEVILDLGDQGTRAEELADVATSVQAIAESLVWHGRVLAVDVREGWWLRGENLWSYAEKVARITGEGQGLSGVREFVDALSSVDWGAAMGETPPSLPGGRSA